MISSHKYKILLTILILFHLIAGTMWLNLNKSMPGIDPANHISNSFATHKCITHITEQSLVECIKISGFYPPFVYILTALFMLFTGISINAARYASIIFLCISIIAIYLWAFQLYKSKFVALLTASTYSLLPLVTLFSRDLWLENALVFLMFFCMFFLLKSNGFSNRRYTFLAFFTLGLGMLTKWNVFLYLIVPFIAEIIIGYNTIGLKALTKTFINGFIVVSIMFSLWFLPNYNEFIDGARYASIPDGSLPQEIISFESIIYYITIIIKYHLGIMLSLLLVVLIPVFIKSNSKFIIFYILGSIFMIYAAFTLIAVKDFRYMLPVLPIIITIIVSSLFKLTTNSLVKDVFAVLILGYLLFYYLVFSFKFPINSEFKYAVNIPVLDYVDIVNLSSQFPAYPYYSNVWPFKPSLQDIVENIRGQSLDLLVLVEYPYFNTNNYALFVQSNNQINVQVDYDFAAKHINSTSEAIKTDLLEIDYILVSQNESTPDYHKTQKVYDEIQTLLLNSEINAEIIAIYKMPADEVYTLLGEPTDSSTRVRYDYCSSVTCDEIYLYKIIK